MVRQDSNIREMYNSSNSKERKRVKIFGKYHGGQFGVGKKWPPPSFFQKGRTLNMFFFCLVLGVYIKQTIQNT